jgi:hypothetical protein
MHLNKSNCVGVWNELSFLYLCITSCDIISVSVFITSFMYIDKLCTLKQMLFLLSCYADRALVAVVHIVAQRTEILYKVLSGNLFMKLHCILKAAVKEVCFNAFTCLKIM